MLEVNAVIIIIDTDLVSTVEIQYNTIHFILRRIQTIVNSSSFELFADNKTSVCVAAYILEVNPDKRPDIFQVSYVAFRISGRDCPVQNLNVSVEIAY